MALVAPKPRWLLTPNRIGDHSYAPRRSHDRWLGGKSARARLGKRGSQGCFARYRHALELDKRPSSNAGWLALIGIAYNLGRWTATAAGLGRVTTKTLRLTIINTPARLVKRSRRRWLRMPTGWPWADHIRDALTAFSRIPAPG